MQAHKSASPLDNCVFIHSLSDLSHLYVFSFWILHFAFLACHCSFFLWVIMSVIHSNWTEILLCKNHTFVLYKWPCIGIVMLIELEYSSKKMTWSTYFLCVVAFGERDWTQGFVHAPSPWASFTANNIYFGTHKKVKFFVILIFLLNLYAFKWHYNFKD